MGGGGLGEGQGRQRRGQGWLGGGGRSTTAAEVAPRRSIVRAGPRAGRGPGEEQPMCESAIRRRCALSLKFQSALVPENLNFRSPAGLKFLDSDLRRVGGGGGGGSVQCGRRRLGWGGRSTQGSCADPRPEYSAGVGSQCRRQDSEAVHAASAPAAGDGSFLAPRRSTGRADMLTRDSEAGGKC